MISKILVSFFFVLLSVRAFALRLEYVGETSITTEAKFNGAAIGGLSAVVWSENTLYALSDDKGRMGEPRFFGFDLAIEKKR